MQTHGIYIYMHTCIYFDSSVKQEYFSYICGEYFISVIDSTNV